MRSAVRVHIYRWGNWSTQWSQVTECGFWSCSLIYITSVSTRQPWFSASEPSGWRVDKSSVQFLSENLDPCCFQGGLGGLECLSSQPMECQDFQISPGPIEWLKHSTLLASPMSHSAVQSFPLVFLSLNSSVWFSWIRSARVLSSCCFWWGRWVVSLVMVLSLAAYLLPFSLISAPQYLWHKN